MSSLLAMLRRPRRGPAVGLALVVVLLAGALTGPAAGDEIDDTRSEVERIADRIEELQHEAELLTERYLDAQLARTTLDDQIADARRRADASGAALEEARTELRAVAVEAYLGADVEAGGGATVLAAGDAVEATLRRGYTSVLAADEDDQLDAYRGQERRAEGDARALDALRAEAAAAEAEIEENRTETEARIAELEELQDEVTGRLRELVEAEQARREAEERRQAEARARQAAEEAARARPAPTPTTTEPEAGTEDDEPGTTTTTPAAPAEPAPTPPPAPSAPPPPAPPAQGAEGAIAAARSVLGTPYRWAGASPEEGFDCSGLIMWAYAQVGVSLPHSSRALRSMSRHIPLDQLQPGDLVFYNEPVSHVGLYIGGGQMIHAPHTGSVVQIKDIHYWSAIAGGGRI